MDAAVPVGFHAVDTRHAEFVDPTDVAGRLAIDTIVAAAAAGTTFTGTRGVSTEGTSPWARRAASPGY